MSWGPVWHCVSVCRYAVHRVPVSVRVSWRQPRTLRWKQSDGWRVIISSEMVHSRGGGLTGRMEPGFFFFLPILPLLLTKIKRLDRTSEMCINLCSAHIFSEMAYLVEWHFSPNGRRSQTRDSGPSGPSHWLDRGAFYMLYAISIWSLHVLSVSVWFFSKESGFSHRNSQKLCT